MVVWVVAPEGFPDVDGRRRGDWRRDDGGEADDVVKDG